VTPLEMIVPSAQCGFRIGVIYQITNILNGKKYIGQTLQNIACRWKAHKSFALSGGDNPLARAIRKYGPDNFVIQVIETCPEPLLNAAEQEAIKRLETCVDRGKGYNSTMGGDSGGSLSAVFRKKLSDAHKGKKLSPEHIKKIAAANRLRIYPSMSEEKKVKLRIAHIGKKLSSQHKASISKALVGRTLTVEHSLKIAEANTGKKYGPVTEEQRRRSSETAKRQWAPGGSLYARRVHVAEEDRTRLSKSD